MLWVLSFLMTEMLPRIFLQSKTLSLIVRSSPGKMRFCGAGGSHTSLKSTVLSFIPPIKIHVELSQSTNFSSKVELLIEIYYTYTLAIYSTVHTEM